MPVSLATCSAILVASLSCFVLLVNREVTQPYLDEFFHIPQAQQYCAGNFRSWDSKITTPPGLYLVAASLSQILGCSTSMLRWENAACIVILFFLLYSTLRSSNITGGSSVQSALNIVLFPPLFFFSALYYTDVPSTLTVLIFYASWKSKTVASRGMLIRGACLYIIGLSTLLFRQTNIFWVAIFPAALDIVEVVDEGPMVVKESMHQGSPGFGDSIINVVRTSWKLAVVYDVSVSEATMNDYFKCIASISARLLRIATDLQLLNRLLQTLSPYLGLLTTFTIFVLYNGSVVLGDKSNHVATLHTTQMLYIWPYILFFSWPVVLPSLLSTLSTISQNLNLTAYLPRQLLLEQPRSLPRLRYILVSAIISVLIVRYNTIIHPFTLADNRHYTFYVFRLLTRPWWMRFMVIPVYILGAWLCIQALDTTSSGSIQARHKHDKTKTSFVLAWFITTTLQLITAPLVEPRYFVLPWIFWRLQIRQQNGSLPSKDLVLWLESLWYLAINITTIHIFLRWKFSWPSEPGNVQRFMW